MPEMPDLLGAWREAADQLQRAAGAVADRTGHGAKDLLAPLARQSEVVQHMLQRQLAIEQSLVHGVIGPAQAVTQALERAPETIRAQATAFRAAAVSFEQAADLLDIQAQAVEQTIGALRVPADLARHGIGRAPDSEA